MSKCLKRAHKAKLQSIALPALGTGVLGMPPNESATVMYEEVDKFSRKCPSTTVKDVRFVIFETDTSVLQVIVH